MKKYVLDTSVLLHDPEAIYAFEDNKVVIPWIVLKEIETKRKEGSQAGKNARQIIRELENIFDEDYTELVDGNINQGIKAKLESGTVLYLLNNNSLVEINWEDNDRKIIARTRGLEGILVTKDKAMKLIAKTVGIEVEDYKCDKADEIYSGVGEARLTKVKVNKLYNNEELFFPSKEKCPGQYPNQFLSIISFADSSASALTRVVGKRKLELVNSELAYTVEPRNTEQIYALDLLLDPKIDLVTLTGVAGTGKTLLALAAGLEQVDTQDKYQKLIISRPLVPMGNGMGFLPGDKEQKMKPWLKAIKDNIDLLCDSESENFINDMKKFKKLQIEPLPYIRGRSIPNQFFIVDEAQNLTPKEIKTIITRAGKGTKLVLTGDIEQIDNSYLDKNTNGLSYVIDNFKGQSNYGQIMLNKSERSHLAKQAAKLL